MASRRGFLGLFAGGIATAPAMAKQAITELSALDTKLFAGAIPDIVKYDDTETTKGYSDGPETEASPYMYSRSKRSYLKNRILDEVYQDPRAIEYNQRTFRLTSLSPQYAGMRSISMDSKIRWSRKDQSEYARHLQLQELQLQYDGAFDEESDKLKDMNSLGLLEDLPKALSDKLANALLQLPFRRK